MPSTCCIVMSCHLHMHQGFWACLESFLKLTVLVPFLRLRLPTLNWFVSMVDVRPNNAILKMAVPRFHMSNGLQSAGMVQQSHALLIGKGGSCH